METLTGGLLSLLPGSTKLRAYLLKLMPKLKTLTETHLKADSPYLNEQGQIILRFLSKNGIPKKILLEWLTSKAIYH